MGPRPSKPWRRPRCSEVFGVADHSKSAHYAGGLSVEQIKEQHREAARLNKKFGKDFRILKGIESDILADGSLDYPEDVLSSFDFVVASIHGRFKMDRKAQTDRLLRAIANPFTTIVGHMTGRQLQRRPGYEIDIEKVLRACAKHDVVVEINAQPPRVLVRAAGASLHVRRPKRPYVRPPDPRAHSSVASPARGPPIYGPASSFRDRLRCSSADRRLP